MKNFENKTAVMCPIPTSADVAMLMGSTIPNKSLQVPFYSMLQYPGMLLSKTFFKTASAWSKTAKFFGCNSRRRIPVGEGTNRGIMVTSISGTPAEYPAMSQISSLSATRSEPANGNLGKAVLPDSSGTIGSNFFERGSLCFYLTFQKSDRLLSKAFFKTASAWSKTAFFCGRESRQKIETNAFFKMHGKKSQNPAFQRIFLKAGKMANEKTGNGGLKPQKGILPPHAQAWGYLIGNKHSESATISSNCQSSNQHIYL